MNVSALIIALLALIQQSMLAYACSNNPSRIDSIAYLYYRNIALMLTSNNYYYIISEDTINNKSIKLYEPTDRIPAAIHSCDAAIIKDVEDCDKDHQNEHSFVCVKFRSGELKYTSFDISAYLNGETTNWSPIKFLKSDFILSRSHIDYSRKIDSIFQTDTNSEIYFIQGEYYAGIEWSDPCPQTETHITVHEKRSLSELNVFGRIDAAYYNYTDVNHHVLYMFQYDHKQYYKVEIDHGKSGNGFLVSLNTTKHPISSHFIFAKICALDSAYNSSHLLAETSINNVSSHSVLTTAKQSALTLIVHVITVFLLAFN